MYLWVVVGGGCLVVALASETNIVVSNWGYSSDYKILCGGSYFYAGVRPTCQTYGFGWDIGSVPTASANAQISAVLGGSAAWIGGFKNAGWWQWVGGQEGGKSFFYGGTCYYPYQCFWNTGQPGGAHSGLKMLGSPNVGNWSVADPSSALPCIVCERSSCSSFRNCNGEGTASVSGTFPSCTCTCKEAFIDSQCQTRICHVNVDCDPAHAFSVSGTFPACVCACHDGYVDRCRTPSLSVALTVSATVRHSRTRTPLRTISPTASRGSATRSHSHFRSPSWTSPRTETLTVSDTDSVGTPSRSTTVTFSSSVSASRVSPTGTASSTESATITSTPSDSSSLSVIVSASATITTSPTTTTSVSPTVSRGSATISASPTPTTSASPTFSRSVSTTATFSPSASVSPGSPTDTASDSASSTITTTPSDSSSLSPTVSDASATVSASPTTTTSATPTFSPSVSSTLSSSRSASVSPGSPSHSASYTHFSTPSQTRIFTTTPTASSSLLPTASRTRPITESATTTASPPSPTPSIESTISASPHHTRSPTYTPTHNHTTTRTMLPTPTTTFSTSYVRSYSRSHSLTRTGRTRTFTATPPKSVSVTAAATPTPSDSRVLAPASLSAFAGSARTPYIHRYFHSPPARFVGTYSGMPIAFSKTFHQLHARRFLSTSALGRVVRFTLPTDDNATRPVRATVAITHNGGSGRSGYEAAVAAQTLPLGQFALLQNRTAFTDDLGAFACGDLMTAATVQATIAVGARADITVTAPDAAMAAATACSPSAPFSGIVFTEQEPEPAAQLSYVVLAAGRVSTTDERAAFLGGWRGAAGAAALHVSGAGVAFPVFIGDPLNTTATPFPTAQRSMAAAYPRVAAERGVMRIAADTTDAMLCTVGDTLSYAGRYVAPGEVLRGGFPYLCFAHDTVEAMHAACDAAPACTGFTTVVMPAFPNATTVFHEIQGKELPLCLYSAGANPGLDELLYQRMLYTKPVQGRVACAVPVARGGRVAVYVQQTGLSSGTVVVRRGGEVAAQCGREWLFANGFGGLDGQCGGYALCAVLDVLANATIEVVAPDGLQQMGCRNSLGVIVEQIAVDAVQRAAEAPVAVALLDVGSLPGRAVTRPHGAGEALHLFVFAATHAALDVVQSGFSCALAEAAFGNGSCPASAVRFASQDACQVCGGRAGFYSSSQAGRSDECGTRLFCGDFLPLSPGAAGAGATCAQRGQPSASGEPYTGLVSVAMNFSRVVQQTETCSGLAGTVYARPSGSSGDVPVFPLVGAGPGLFQILLGVPAGSGAGRAGGHLGDAGLGDRVTRLMTVGPAGARLDAFYVPWAPLLESFRRAADSWQQRLQPNTTLVCVVDHSGGAPSRCAFPVPRGATKVRVRASQADFATKAMSVVFQTGRYPAATPSVVCGNRRSFSGALGGEGRCDGFETCTDQFIYALDTYADEATGAHVVVELPADLEYRGCNLTATIIAEFSRPLAETAPCPEFECPGERRCIPYAAVCDQQTQCARGTDEEACYTLRRLPDEMFCRSQTQRRVEGAGASLVDCRRAAVVRQSPAFALHNGSCIVYGAAETVVMFDSPAAYVCEAPGATTYLYLVDGPAQYRQCRASVHCSGNGVLAEGASGEGAAASACACTCFEGFSGDTCADRLSLETIASVVVALPVATLADSVYLSRNVIAAALRLGSSSVGVACADITAMNATAVYVACTVTSLTKTSDAYFHSRTLLSAKTLSKINALLTLQYHANVLFVTTRSVLRPVLSFGLCNTTMPDSLLEGQAFNASAGRTCPVASAFERIRIASVENRSVLSMRVTVSDPSAAPSQSRARREVVCQATSTASGGGCITSTCDVAMAGSATSRITVSDVVFANATLLTSSCAARALRASGIATIGSLPVVTNATASNALEDFSAYFVGGIVVFLCGSLILAALAIVFWRLYRRRMAEARAANALDAGRERASPVVATMYDLLLRQFFEQQCEREGRLHPKRWAYGLLIIGMACGVLASFLTIYYKTAYGVQSNFSVMYEEYSDSQCQASDISSVPRRIFAVAPGTYQCTKMQAAGESVGAVYALGRCTGGEGRYRAVIRIGGSPGTCAVAPEVSVASGRCVPLSALSPGTSRSVFVSLTCSDAARIGARIARLDALTQTSEVMVAARVVEPAADLRLAAPATTPRGALSSGFLVGSARRASTSFAAGVVEAQATGADFDGNDDPQRLVLQSAGCTFLVGDHGACLSAAASALQPLMGAALASPLAPSAADAPVGFVFGGFGTSQPETWIGAGPTAHRYYDVAGTSFDMGAVFPKSSAALVDGEGYSVSLFMRADAETLGFAYAVTDALENSAEGYAYTLHRLARIIDNGQGGGAWYNHTYRVYHSLYVNGPGRSLIVAYADPGFASRVQLLDFDLVAIGMERVFNGLWHHIAVVFLVENGKARAQLMVDGETYNAKSGWSACVDTFPAPMARHAPNATMPVHSLATDSVRNRGLLVTGYFNGGVYALQASAVEKANTDFLVGGTAAMRAHNPFPREPTLYLGLATVVAGLAFLATAAAYLVQSRGDGSGDNAAFTVQAAMRFYAALKAFAALPKEQGLFAGEEAEQEPSGDRVALQPLRFMTVLRWTGLSAAEMATVMDGISQLAAADSAARTLLFVMQMRRMDPTLEAFTIAEWNAEVGADPGSAGRGLRFWAVPESDDAHERALFRKVNIPDPLGETLQATRTANAVAGDDEPVSPPRPEELGSNEPFAEGPEENPIPPSTSCQHDAEEEMSKETEADVQDADADDNHHDKVDEDEGSASGAEQSSSGESSDSDKKDDRQDANIDALPQEEAPETTVPPQAEGVNTHHAHNAEDVAPDDENEDVDAELQVPPQLTTLFSAILNVLAPVVTTFQVVYVWMTSMDMPPAFKDAFRGLFSFLSIDFATTFAQIPTLVTPLVQLFAGLVAMGLFVHFMLGDNARFERRLAQYVWRRDAQALALKAHPPPSVLAEPTEPVDGPPPDVLLGRRRSSAFVLHLHRHEHSDGEDEAHAMNGQTHPGTACLKETVANDQCDKAGIFALPPALAATLADAETAEEAVAVQVLPFVEARKVDMLVGRIDDPRGILRRHLEGGGDADGTPIAPSSAVRVYTHCGRGMLVQESGKELVMSPRHWPAGGRQARGAAASEEVAQGTPNDDAGSRGAVDLLSEEVHTLPAAASPPPADEEGPADAAVEAAGAESPWQALRTVGVRCQRHPDRRLVPQLQTGVWPFSNVPACCLVVDGQRCGEACGTIYHCGHTHRSEIDGHPMVCTYALCERHCRLSVPELLAARVLGLVRDVRRHGLPWLVCFALMYAANTAYTPFLKTALMILGCHPFYQCEFKQCAWEAMNQKYALAVYLSMVVVVVFGLGFPATLLALLWRRRSLMRCFFLDASYEGRYQKEAVGDAESTEPASTGPSPSSQSAVVGCVSCGSKSGEVSDDEWGRFVSTDGTILSRDYNGFYPQWMFITGVLVFFKVLAMVPALFLEPRSFDQRLGVTLVEVAVALFFFVTRPQMNHLSALALHSGCVYRILLVGLQGLSLVRQNDTGADLTDAMVAITAIYFLFNVALVAVIVVAPVVRQRLRQRYMRRLLNRHAIDYVDEISLYEDPLSTPSPAKECA